MRDSSMPATSRRKEQGGGEAGITPGPSLTPGLTPDPSPNENPHLERGSGGNDQREAGGGEEAGLGVDGFAEVLGTDAGVVAAMLGNGTINMLAVGGDEGADIIGGEVEEALEAVPLLGLQGNAALAFEQGTGGPGSAPENTGGIGDGGHRVEILVELGGGDFLGFVNGEEQVGGGANDLGTRFAGEELQAGLTKLVKVTLGGFPNTTRGRRRENGRHDPCC